MPRRGVESTKFSSGNVVVVGGSRGLTGAPCMSALAAMRAGAGYVTVAAPASLELSFTVRLLEAMLAGLPEDDGALSPEALQAALKAIERADAVVLGPGLGRAQGTQELARELVAADRRAARDRRRRAERAGRPARRRCATGAGRPC